MTNTIYASTEDLLRIGNPLSVWDGTEALDIVVARIEEDYAEKEDEYAYMSAAEIEEAIINAILDIFYSGLDGYSGKYTLTRADLTYLHIAELLAHGYIEKTAADVWRKEYAASKLIVAVTSTHSPTHKGETP